MKIKFNEEQLKLLKTLDIPYSVTGDLDDGKILDMDTVVTDHLIENGIDEDESVNEVGKLCESILEILGNI